MGDLFQAETARRLWEESRQRAENPVPGKSIDFSGMTFPPDPTAQNFTGIHFTTPVDFSNARFETNNIWNSDIFMGVKFSKEVNFNNASFQSMCIFKECIFEDEVYFGSTQFGKIAIFSATFKCKADFTGAMFDGVADFGGTFAPAVFEAEAIFSDAVFKGDTLLKSVTFEGEVDFQKSRFEYWTQFVETIFVGQANFSKSRFARSSGARDLRRNLVRFQNTKFEEGASFRSAVFDCKAAFRKVSFHADVDLRGARFGDQVDFDACVVESRLLLNDKYEQVFSNCEDAIVPYRLAKQAASACGDSRWTGSYHFQEQCATNAKRRRDSTLRVWEGRFWHLTTNAIWNYGELLLGRGIFGYGEKPLRPLLVGLGVVLVCGFGFWIFKGIEPNPPCSIWSSLYFSVVTFTTLGYGDLQPTPGMRWLSALEASLGAALMALFVVALARRFTR